MPSHGNEVKFVFLGGKTHSCLRLKREQLFCHKIKSAILGHHKQKKKKNIRQEILRLLCQISELVSLTWRTFPAVLHTPLFFPIPPYSTSFLSRGLAYFSSVQNYDVILGRALRVRMEKYPSKGSPVKVLRTAVRTTMQGTAALC